MVYLKYVYLLLFVQLSVFGQEQFLTQLDRSPQNVNSLRGLSINSNSASRRPNHTTLLTKNGHQFFRVIRRRPNSSAARRGSPDSGWPVGDNDKPERRVETEIRSPQNFHRPNHTNHHYHHPIIRFRERWPPPIIPDITGRTQQSHVNKSMGNLEKPDKPEDLNDVEQIKPNTRPEFVEQERFNPGSVGQQPPATPTRPNLHQNGPNLKQGFGVNPALFQAIPYDLPFGPEDSPFVHEYNFIPERHFMEDGFLDGHHPGFLQHAPPPHHQHPPPPGENDGVLTNLPLPIQLIHSLQVHDNRPITADDNPLIIKGGASVATTKPDVKRPKPSRPSHEPFPPPGNRPPRLMPLRGALVVRGSVQQVPSSPLRVRHLGVPLKQPPAAFFGDTRRQLEFGSSSQLNGGAEPPMLIHENDRNNFDYEKFSNHPVFQLDDGQREFRYLSVTQRMH